MPDQITLAIARQLEINSFCATGEGGGVDPSCSPKDGGGESLRGLLTGDVTPEKGAKAKAIIDGAKTHAELKALAKEAGVTAHIGKSLAETKRLMHQLVSKLAVSSQQTKF